MKSLEDRGLVTIVWKNGKEDHIIEKVLLNERNVDEVYAYMKRKPRAEYVRSTCSC